MNVAVDVHLIRNKRPGSQHIDLIKQSFCLYDL